MIVCNGIWMIYYECTSYKGEHVNYQNSIVVLQKDTCSATLKEGGEEDQGMATWTDCKKRLGGQLMVWHGKLETETNGKGSSMTSPRVVRDWTAQGNQVIAVCNQYSLVYYVHKSIYSNGKGSEHIWGQGRSMNG